MQFSIILIALTVACSHAENSEEWPQYAYFDKLSRSHLLTVPPATKPLIVSIGADVLRIAKINDKKQEMDIEFVLHQLWTDERLEFDFGDADEGHVVLPRAYHDKIWKPDHSISNVVSEQNKPGSTSTGIEIWKNGTVQYTIHYDLSAYCRMNFQKLPFDENECRINISDPTQKLHYQLKDDLSAKQERHDEVPLFKIKSVDVQLLENDAKANSELAITVVFSREFSYYMHNVFTPFLLLVNVSWLTFFIHPSKVAARIIFLTVLLCTAVMLSAFVNSKLPATTSGNAIGTWTSGCTLFIFLALIETVVAIHFHRAKKEQEEEEARKNDEETLMPVRTTPGSRWKERESKKGCLAKCNNWMTQRADKIDTLGRHIITGLFLVFVIFYIIRIL